MPATPPDTPPLQKRRVRFNDSISYRLAAITLPEPIHDRFMRAQREDEELQSIVSAIKERKSVHPRIQLGQCELRDESLYYRDRLYVPNDDELKAKLLRLYYETPAAGYPGRAKTYDLVSREYY